MMKGEEERTGPSHYHGVRQEVTASPGNSLKPDLVHVNVADTIACL